MIDTTKMKIYKGIKPRKGGERRSEVRGKEILQV